MRRTSSKGLALRLDFYPAIDAGQREPWTVDLIEAHTNTGPVGHIKLGYITAQRMAERFPTAFEFAVRQNGVHLAVKDLLEKPADRWTRDDVLHALKNTDGWLTAHQEELLLAQRQAADTITLLRMWAKRRETIAAQHQDAYKRLRSMHENRPNVDYISVRDADDSDAHIAGRYLHDASPTPGFRRLGVGSALYETAAVWMASRGMNVHASGLQSDEAKAVWSSLAARGVTRTVPANDNDRVILDADALLAAHPELRLP
jgi:hypothetical protein